MLSTNLFNSGAFLPSFLTTVIALDPGRALSPGRYSLDDIKRAIDGKLIPSILILIIKGYLELPLKLKVLIKQVFPEY
jgi:hypothetical protein